MQKITTALWFEKDGEKAAEYYCSLFKNSKIVRVFRSRGDVPAPKGSVVAIDFVLDGNQFNIINGGPMFQLSEAVSLSVDCEDQAEVDEYWDKLVQAGAKPTACGWIKDPFGISWQIVPRRFMELIRDTNPAKVKAVMAAMMTMVKLDVAALERAYREA